MNRLSSAEQIMYAELSERAHDAEFDRQFPLNGQFSKEARTISRSADETRDYWYYQGYRKASEDHKGQRYRMYVGPAGDAAIEERIKRFQVMKSDARERSQYVNQLKSLGNPSPEPMAGEITKVLAEEGVFRMRGLLVGSMAYQTFGSLIGVKLPQAQMTTRDVDFAQDHGISISIDDKTSDLLEALKRYDESFRPVPHISDKVGTTSYVNDRKFRVDFITSHRASDDVSDKVTDLPSLGVGAVPLRYTDFLIKDPMRAVLLHQAGVSVRVPQPARYAVHKMIVSTERAEQGGEKSAKDSRQASDLVVAHDLTGRGYEVAGAWMEAWERGPRWREALAKGAMRLSPNALQALDKHVTLASPEHGFREGVKPERALASNLPKPKAPETAQRRGDLER